MAVAFMLAVIIGSSLGSLLNACAYRIPRHKTVVRGRSSCPFCSVQLRWFELIPVASFIVLHARCSHCGARLPLQYLVIETLCGAIAAIVTLLLGCSAATILLIVFVFAMILISLIDWHHYVIPNRVLGWTFGLLLGVKLLEGASPVKQGLVSLFVALLALLALYLLGRILVGREWLGMGDVKLAGLIAFVTGLPTLALSLWLAALAGLLLIACTRMWPRLVPAYGDAAATPFIHRESGASGKIPFGSLLASVSAVVAFAGACTDFSLTHPGVPWMSM